jgi:hypothetical protein
MVAKRLSVFAVSLGLVLVFARHLDASPITFESFADGDALTNQIAGLTFANTFVVSAGLSLNESEFPPHSGANVVVDLGGPITIAFATPVAAVSGFFTYGVALSFSAFDSTNSLIGTVASSFNANTALSGDAGSSPNELLELLSPLGIASIVILGDQAGLSFVLDDLTVTPFADATPVPEPSTLMLLGLGVAAACRRIRRRSPSEPV